jgi:adenylate cyclase
VANTSARLCSAAVAGQILVGESTLEQLSGRFKYKELDPVHLKGKRGPFRVFEIQRPARGVAVSTPMESTDLDARN